MTTDFLSRLLPTTGLYCTGRLLPKGGFAHQFFTSIEDTVASLSALDAAGNTMYLAQGTFTAESAQNCAFNKALPFGAPKEQRKKERAGSLAHAMRSFFVDIDCGEAKFAAAPTKAYPTQLEALTDLRRTVIEIGLPFPAIVNSGHGLYAHWLIEEDIPAAKWSALADIFKRLLTHHKFKQDPSRTSDVASVLRPVGTHNRKTDLRPVRLLKDAPAMPLVHFIEIMDKASKAAKLAAPALAIPTQFKGINDEFTAGLDGPPADGRKVAQKCAHVAFMRDNLGNIPEPQWYATLGLLRYCADGEALIHEWSAGHPDYSPAATDDKIQQHIGSGAGPTTCIKFASEDSNLCLGCASTNKVKSPIVLGRPELAIVEAATEEEEEILPRGFQRNADGLFALDDDSAPTRFYPYDLYPSKLAHDSSLGYETVTIRHKLPRQAEYVEFAFRSALLHDRKAMLMALADGHVQVSGKEAQTAMCAYLDAYMARLRAMKNMTTLHSQMGWAKDGAEDVFVLGDRLIKGDDQVEVAGLAKNIPDVAKAFHAKGSLSEWRKSTDCLGLPGMEPLAFAFLAGAFGAPLMKYTGYSGAAVALVGASGIGKTLIGKLTLSVYGDPNQLELMKNDTINALISRLGLYGSLPLYLDEVSNIDGQELSDILYRITQGRDKARLGRDAREKTILNSWNTIALLSSNHSLTDKLSNLKGDASAEINRIMELHCNKVAGFGRTEATKAYNAAQDNYGTAGGEYIKYLVEHNLDHKQKIMLLTEKIDTLTGAGNDERFWSAMSAVAIYGGLIAKKLGLIEFEVAPIMAWLTKKIKSLREDKTENVATQLDVLGQFLDDCAANIMITTGDNGKNMVSPLREHRGALLARIMHDQGQLVISRAAIKKYLDKTYGSYTDLKNELTEQGILKDSNARRVLGAGTYVGGTQQPVWIIDLNAPGLGRKTLAVVRSLADFKEGVL
jgi:hypothetical protein